MNESNYTLSDIAAVTGNGAYGNGNGGAFGGNWGEWIILFLIFALFGGNWGNFGGGFGGGSGGSSGASAYPNYVLSSDFATLQRQMSDGFNSQERRTDSIINGICDLGYTQQSLANGINTTVMTGNYGTQSAINGLSSQLASCCCDIREGISGINYNNALVNSALQRQISDCCCGTERQIERGFADTNYNNATQHCQTMTAIDKVGDRIIDYLANEKAQSLRDENFALRLAASQAKQNNDLLAQLSPCPKPAYITCNPNAPLNYSISYGNGNCGCSGCGC